MTEIDQNWDRLIGDRVRLRELRILHTVVRCGSMAKAAAMLGMTQPAVSQAIAMLEANLGVPLLERSPAGVTPTEFGEIILRRATDAFNALAEGVREVTALADPAGGEITVGASESYIAGGVLARTVIALRYQYPRMRIHVAEANSAALDFAGLRDRRMDVMLGRAAVASLPDDIQADVLLEEKLLVVTGAQNAWGRKPGMTFADLADKPWVLAPSGTAVHELVAAAFRAQGAAMPPVAISTWSMMLRLQLLSAGEHVTAFPESLVRNNAARWSLQVLPLTLGPSLPVAAFTLRNRARTRTVQVFIAVARTQSTADVSLHVE